MMRQFTQPRLLCRSGAGAKWQGSDASVTTPADAAVGPKGTAALT